MRPMAMPDRPPREYPSPHYEGGGVTSGPVVRVVRWVGFLLLFLSERLRGAGR